MQVGEQHHVLAEEAEFLRLGFLDLHHQVGPPGFIAAHHRCPRRSEGVVGDAGPVARTGFDPHLQPLAHQLPDGIRGEGHPLFIGLDLPRNTDAGHRCRKDGGCHRAPADVPSIWLQPAAIGNLQPLPKAWGLTLSSGAAWRRLNSARRSSC